MTDRRNFIIMGAAGLLIAAADPKRPDTNQPNRGPTVPGLNFVFGVKVLIGTPQELGQVDGIRKRVIPIIGGEVSGPRLTGSVLAGGADWQSILPDGTADIWARYTMRATDGTLISVTNPGYRRGPPAVLARIAAGEMVDPALYYFRSTPRFETASNGPHAWLARSVFVCSAARYADHVLLNIFEVT